MVDLKLMESGDSLAVLEVMKSVVQVEDLKFMESGGLVAVLEFFKVWSQ